MNELAANPSRFQRAYFSQFGSNILHLQNPWIAVFWSFAFPGCGNLLQGRLLKGLTLVTWELVINTNAKINLAIMYSLIGQFDMAKQVINTKWFLLYMGIYVYAMWDSYRGTVDLNKLSILAAREDAYIKPFIIKTLDTNYIDKRNPWIAAMWSMLSPGIGHLYLHKVVSGIFFILWTIAVVYFAHALQALHFTMIGQFSEAKSILDMQWFMYLPSIYGFVVHDCYASAVECNKLLEYEQSKFLKGKYQPAYFKMPI